MADLLAYALTTVADVKESLGITDSSQDNLIIRKINQATLMIENYTGRRFKLTTYTDDEYDATGTDQLVLRQRPVVIDDDHPFLMGYRNTSLNDDDWSDSEANLQFVDSAAGIVDLDFQVYGRWNRWRVTYSAGYATIPSDIAEAAASLAAYLTNTSGSNTGTGSIKSKQEGQRKEEYYDPIGTAGSGTNRLFDLLNITGTLNSYSNNPILADV